MPLGQTRNLGIQIDFIWENFTSKKVLNKIKNKKMKKQLLGKKMKNTKKCI